MIPIEEIERNIVEYGYIKIKPKKIIPSYYKLEDGTIIEALIKIESIVEDLTQPNGHIVRTSTDTKVYVSREKRNPNGFIPYQLSDLATGIINEDVKAEELSSEFSEYELSNGIIINIRTIVNQIKKTRFYSREGEPIYSVFVTPIIKYLSKK